jgi:hypothetical protein
MGLERAAFERELGRKSTHLRARQRGRAHLERADHALQRAPGRRLRGKKPVERCPGSDRRSGTQRLEAKPEGACRPGSGDAQIQRCSASPTEERAGAEGDPSPGTADHSSAPRGRYGASTASRTPGRPRAGRGRTRSGGRASPAPSARAGQAGRADTAFASSAGWAILDRSPSASPANHWRLGFAGAANRTPGSPRRCAASRTSFARAGRPRRDPRPPASSRAASSDAAASAIGWKRSVPCGGSARPAGARSAGVDGDRYRDARALGGRTTRRSRAHSRG